MTPAASGSPLVSNFVELLFAQVVGRGVAERIVADLAQGLSPIVYDVP